ncbi:MAG: hypothetical protein WA825_06805 [Steroidobacteraceae bacterium]
MNSRVLTAPIALVAFAATLALIAGPGGKRHAAQQMSAPLATLAAPPVSLPPTAVVAAPATERTESKPVGAPLDERADPPAQAAQPADTSEFLAAQDRAAAHSSRSR